MKDDMDIEKTLKQYRSDPSPHVKQSVMNHFASKHGDRREANHGKHPAGFDGGANSAGTGRWWRRPVPLYIFAAGVVLAIGLSFVAGRMTSITHDSSHERTAVQPASYSVDLEDIQWETATNDVL